MEKLEKLLKEYAPNYCNDLPNGIIMDELVISKRFWFIKWLVENDKIDLLKLTCMNPQYTEILDSDFSWEERIIMVLSIEENPISFLISILK